MVEDRNDKNNWLVISHSQGYMEILGSHQTENEARENAQRLVKANTEISVFIYERKLIARAQTQVHWS